MKEITCLHKPQWNLVGDEWQMIVGNRLAAKITPNVDKIFPEYVWLTLIEDDFEEHGWHAVDYGDLDSAKFDLEMWWDCMCRGEKYEPEKHCLFCREGIPHR